MSPSMFEYEMKKFDKLLRLRKAKLGSCYFIERKARRGSMAVPNVKYGVSIDRFIRDKEGYVLVTRLHKNELTKNMLLDIRRCDMWEKRHGVFGAEGMFKEEMEQDKAREIKLEKKASERIRDESSEVYDKQMSRQGDIVYPGLKGPVAGNKT